MNPKLRDDAVPVFLPRCPSYYSQSAAKRSRRSLDSKDDEFLNQAWTLSVRSDAEEKERFKVTCFQEMQGKLSLISLPKTWSLWNPDEHFIFMRPQGFIQRVAGGVLAPPVHSSAPLEIKCIT